mmetsp:Transcript_24591/g.80589  ORF Transcript_24591/g.80589 Transcript_24591/m.80589 type:complete len:310 (-) Transcript_24591:1168-2097(-)
MTRVRRKREEHVRAPVRPTTPPELRQALGVGEKGQREEFARKILQDVMAEESRRSSRSSRREDVQRSESAMSYYGHEQSLSMESLHLRNIDSARSHPDFRSSSPLAMSQRPHTSRTVAVSFYDEKLEVEDQDPSHMDDEFFITSTKFHEEQSQQPNSHLSAPQHEHHDGANHLQHRPLPSVVKELLPHYMDQTPTGRQEAALKTREMKGAERILSYYAKPGLPWTAATKQARFLQRVERAREARGAPDPAAPCSPAPRVALSSPTSSSPKSSGPLSKTRKSSRACAFASPRYKPAPLLFVSSVSPATGQ